MVNVNEVYEICRDLIRKSQSGGYFDETVFNRYAKIAQLEYYNDTYKLNESSQENDDSLAELDAEPITVGLTGGRGAYPSDYWHTQFAYLPYKVNGKNINVEIVQPAELAMRLSSEFIAPNEQNPVAVLKDSYFEVYPSSIKQLSLSYLRTPPNPFWNYTVSSNRKVFAASGGTGTNPNASSKNLFNTDNVNVSRDTITIERHGFYTGQPVLYSDEGGTTIGGLTDATDYFIIEVDSNTIKLANSRDNAFGGTALNLTTTPSTESQSFTITASDHSTDFLVPSYQLSNIVGRILALMGISVREYEITQIAASGTAN